MRTLTALFALLLLALQTPAEPLRERAAELPSQEQPEAQDQDIAISFAGDQSATREAAGFREKLICSCNPRSCDLRENQYGTCNDYSTPRRLCCRETI